MSLSVLIATVPERSKEFASLHAELTKQKLPFGADIEIVVDARPRPNQPGGISIGAKRDSLLHKAQGLYVVFADDDDTLFPWYISDIMKALENRPDCVGQYIKHISDGRRAPDCVHSLRFKAWSNGPVRTPGFGMVYQRNVTHRNPVRRTIALQVGFPDLRWGEDQPYSDGVTALCKTEVMVTRPAFTYRFSSKEPHSVKYGTE